ncbi:MAG TPA: cyclic nucleotide-binding protein, partial [Rhodospirillales bacterium]|nr:cyclic nucleotide-binding protein [Rhodospirillales bacterium]
PMRWAEVMNNFGQVAQMLGGQLRNAEVLEKAAEACRGALEVRTREEMPLLWAATQNNLGSAMFLLAS